MLGGVLIALATTKGFSAYGQAVTLGRIGNRIIAGYQKRLYDNLLAQGVSFFSDRHSAEFLNRLNSGAAGARAILSILITTIGRDLLSLIGLVIVMVIQDAFLAFICLVALPVAVVGVRSLIRRTRKIVQRQFVGAGKILLTMQETIQGIRMVKSFNLEDMLRTRMNAHVGEVEQAMNKWVRVSARSSPLMEMLGGFAVAAAVMYAGFGVLKGGRLPGEFFSVITALLLAYEPAKRLARVNIDVAANLVYVRKLFEIIDSKPVEREPEGLPQLAVKGGKIEFRDVEFAYRPGEPLLRRFSFTAEPRPDHRHRRSVGRRQIHRHGPDRALLRAAGGRHPDRRAGYRESHPPLAAATRSPMSARTYSCSPAASATTSRSAAPTRAKARSSRRPRPPTPTISSSPSARATTPPSASTACSFRAGSARASRSPARS